MNILNRKQILAADDIVREPLIVPEWGGQVFLRSLNGIERGDFDNVNANFRDKKLTNMEFLLNLVVRCVCDENDNLLFTPDDIGALLKKNGDVIMTVYQAAARVNALTDDAVEDLAKNSESGPSDDSTSG